MTSSPLALDTTPVDPLDGVSDTVRAAIADAERNLANLQRTVTQREWLLITTALDRPRQTIVTDGNLRLLALAWVKEKHTRGGASWDVLLEMTDEDLLAFHGFPTEDPEAGVDPEDLEAGIAPEDLEEPTPGTYANPGDPDRP